MAAHTGNIRSYIMGKVIGTKASTGMKIICTIHRPLLFFCQGVFGSICKRRGSKGELTKPHLIIEITQGQTQYHDYVCNSLLLQITKYGWNKSQVKQSADNLIKIQGSHHPTKQLKQVIYHSPKYNVCNIYIYEISYIHMILYIYIYMCICMQREIYIYIYIYRERERERYVLFYKIYTYNIFI